MSKTVMRVMMIGLVAMLGAKAEAHYFIVGGKAKYCSVCVDAKLEDHPQGTHTEEVEFRLDNITVETLCPQDSTTVITKTVPGPLIVRKPILQQGLNQALSPFDLNGDGLVDLKDIIKIDLNVTSDEDPTTADTAEVEGVFSDTYFRVKNGSLNSCGALSPIDVLVRATDVHIKTFWCDPANCIDPTPTGSTFDATNCRLATKFELKAYPKNLPPIGTLYDCPNPVIVP